MADRDLERIDRIASLARIELDDQEREEFAPQLARILDHFQALSEIGSAPAAAQAQRPAAAVLREDSPGAGLEKSRLLDGAPGSRDGYFCVPKTVGED